MVSYIDSYNDFIFNFLVYHYYWILLSSDQLIAVLCVFFSIWILFLKPDFHFDIVPLIVVKETHTACLDSILYKLNTGNGANKHIYLLNFIISLNETIRVEIHTYIHHTKSFPSRILVTPLSWVYLTYLFVTRHIDKSLYILLLSGNPDKLCNWVIGMGGGSRHRLDRWRNYWNKWRTHQSQLQFRKHGEQWICMSFFAYLNMMLKFALSIF